MNLSIAPGSGEPSDQASTAVLRALATRYQATLERERRWLAQELHENLTQKLTVISLELSLLDGTLGTTPAVSQAKVRLKLKELGAIVGDMIQSLRQLKTNLRPKILDEFGLIAALECETQDFAKRTGLQVRFNSNADAIELPDAVVTQVFRTAQQIMANIVQHANARHVEVELVRERDGLLVRILDDGKGISPEQVASPTSLGLCELKERTRAIGGHFTIEGTPGAGTKVTVRVPLPATDTSGKPREGR